MRRLVIVGLVLLLAPATAAAKGENAGAKALIQAQAKAMRTGAEAFVATFTADALVFVPPGVASGSDEIGGKFEEAFTDAHDELVSVKVKNLKIGVLDDAAWLTADLVCKWVGHGENGETVAFAPTTMRVTELVVRDGDAWKGRAAHFSVAISDADAKEYALDLTTIAGAESDDDHAAMLASPARLLALVGRDKATVLLGSASEKAVGAAKVKKLLKKWSKLQFTVVGGVLWQATESWTFAAANVDLPSGGTTLHYRVLAIFETFGDGLELVSLHYSSAR